MPRLGGAPRGALAWCALCVALGLPAWLMPPVSLPSDPATWPALAQAWALHPDAGLQQPPWVWWSSAWLHGSAQHLNRNLIALGLMAALGVASQVPTRSAVLWALAWPLTQLGMLWPGSGLLHTYVGLSGVLHAGAAVLAMQGVLQRRHPAYRLSGALLLLGLAAKVIMENPWQHTLIQPIGSDITVAPWAHLSGIGAGAILCLCSTLLPPGCTASKD